MVMMVCAWSNRAEKKARTRWWSSSELKQVDAADHDVIEMHIPAECQDKGLGVRKLISANRRVRVAVSSDARSHPFLMIREKGKSESSSGLPASQW